MSASERGPAASHAADHVFLGAGHARNERRTWFVIMLTAVTMVVEIAAGSIFGSMALIADGWHMATHAMAMLITAFAYLFARRNALNRRFTFGTGKLGELAAFASAIILGLVALLIGWESLLRLRQPVAIEFGEAIAVAVLGLIVNLASAWMLRAEPHHHPDGEPHDHQHQSHGGDNNLRAAYAHVLADGLTSLLAIGALLAGSIYGWLWLDPVIGIVGALVIARWSVSLIRDAGAVLLDYMPAGEQLPDQIRRSIETESERITDLHVWRLGPGHVGVIISIASAQPRAPSHYRDKLSHLHGLSHVTIEVEPVRS
jgi:cation diffusion facilitator family transporter